MHPSRINTLSYILYCAGNFANNCREAIKQNHRHNKITMTNEFQYPYLKIQKNQLIRNALCMNQLADFMVFTEYPYLFLTFSLEFQFPQGWSCGSAVGRNEFHFNGIAFFAY